MANFTNEKFLKGIPYSNLRDVFLNNINYQYGYIDLFNHFEDASAKKLQKFMIEILAKEFTPEELQKLFNCDRVAPKLKIKFCHTDNWCRPVFRVLGREHCFLCDTNNLFRDYDTEETIKEFYKDKTLNEYLTYYGTNSNCEPNGGTIKAELILV